MSLNNRKREMNLKILCKVFQNVKKIMRKLTPSFWTKKSNSKVTTKHKKKTLKILSSK